MFAESFELSFKKSTESQLHMYRLSVLNDRLCKRFCSLGYSYHVHLHVLKPKYPHVLRHTDFFPMWSQSKVLSQECKIWAKIMSEGRVVLDMNANEDLDIFRFAEKVPPSWYEFTVSKSGCKYYCLMSHCASHVLSKLDNTHQTICGPNPFVSCLTQGSCIAI